MTYEKWEEEKEVGSQLPTFDEEFRERLDVIARSFGSRDEAAKAAGVSVGQLIKYIKGRSIPTFPIMVNLLRHSKYSLDWLAYGQESHKPMISEEKEEVIPLHEDAFRGSIEAVEAWLKAEEKTLDPEAKARACYFLYKLSVKVPGLQADGSYDEDLLDSYLNSL